MRRDAELIRRILLSVDGAAVGAPCRSDAIAGDGPETTEAIAYHVELLRQAGFLDVAHVGTLRQPASQLSLTWRGHEFLELIRRDDVWLAVRQVGDVPFELLELLARREVAKQVGLVTGGNTVG